MHSDTALEQLHGIIDNMEHALSRDVGLDGLDIDSIMMCAMGGSAISANIIADCCSTYVGIPISVNRSPLIPQWVGPRTLVIISSYSGNTDETIEMYNRAKMQKAPVVIITAGGKLKEIADRDNCPIMLLPQGLQDT